MTPLHTLLITLASNVALVGALAWLARELSRHWLSKDLELHKAKLTEASTLATEKLRHDLALRALEHQVRFSKLHERRADVIAEAYDKLVQAYWAHESFASPFEGKGDLDKQEKFVEAMRLSGEFFRFFDRNRIFLPTEICDKLDAFSDGMRKESIGFGVWVNMERIPGAAGLEERKLEAWIKASRFFEGEAPKARRLLEDELRRILCGEKSPLDDRGHR